MEQINTHFYDRKIGNIYRELCVIQNTKDNYLVNIITPQQLFIELLETLYIIQLSPLSKSTINNMLNLLKNDIANNYDKENCIETLDILARTWFYVKKLPLEDRKILLEQIGEIKYGVCAQGRTTRIFQIFYSFF
jgi:hypothetical protein